MGKTPNHIFVSRGFTICVMEERSRGLTLPVWTDMGVMYRTTNVIRIQFNVITKCQLKCVLCKIAVFAPWLLRWRESRSRERLRWETQWALNRRGTCWSKYLCRVLTFSKIKEKNPNKPQPETKRVWKVSRKKKKIAVVSLCLRVWSRAQSTGVS